MAQKTAVLLDFDGTIMDTNQAIINSWHATFRELEGRDGDEDVILATFGETLEDSMRHMFPDVPVERSRGIYRDYQAKHLMNQINLFPGIRELLDTLADRGIRMGLATSRLKATTMQALETFDLLQGVDPAPLTEAERALYALCVLTVRCRSTDDPAAGSIYDALIGCEADSRGMALAYVELCRRLGLSCQLVEGQRNHADHDWTIVQIGGEFYHVDPFICRESGIEAGFLLSDEDAWGAWRWDYFAYPHCAGKLSAAAVDRLHAAGAGEQNLPENEITP